MTGAVHSRVKLVFRQGNRDLSGTFCSCHPGTDGRCRLGMLFSLLHCSELQYACGWWQYWMCSITLWILNPNFACKQQNKPKRWCSVNSDYAVGWETLGESHTDGIRVLIYHITWYHMREDPSCVTSKCVPKRHLFSGHLRSSLKFSLNDVSCLLQHNERQAGNQWNTTKCVPWVCFDYIITVAICCDVYGTKYCNFFVRTITLFRIRLFCYPMRIFICVCCQSLVIRNDG